MAPAGWAAQATRAVILAWSRQIRPEADFQLTNSFYFSNLFCKLQIKFEFQQLLLAQ
jgi:hypothetical protein